MKQNIKKLSLQYEYLSLEKEEIFDACTSVEKEIRKYLLEHYKDIAIDFYNQEETKECHPEADEKNKIIKPKKKEIKKLYRKIASKIHPDKTKDENEIKLFSDAIVAYENNDLGKLLEISNSIKIEIPNLSNDCIYILEENIASLIKEIDSKKITSAWAWYNAENEEKKLLILKHIANSIAGGNK